METVLPTDTRTGRRWVSFILCVLAACAGVVLVIETWLAMGDVLVDFGRELYVPWRIGEGDVLYRDLAYFNGPLSPYWNAAMFGLFGASYRTLILVNLAIAAGTAVVLHRVLARIGTDVTAGIGLLFAIPVFFLPHGGGYPNYSFVAPYSHEMTHGFALALMTLYVAMRNHSGRRGWAVVTGVLLGLVFLTKAEIFAATAFALVSLFAVRRSASGVGSMGLGLAVPIVIAWLALSTAMPASEALYGTLGSWTGIADARLHALPFYRVGMGLDAPGRNLAHMLLALAVVIATFVPAVGVGALVRGDDKWRFAIAAALGLVVVAVWILIDSRAKREPNELQKMLDSITVLARSLPFVTIVALAALFGLRARGDPAQRSRVAERAAFVVFGLALLAKMILNPRFEHYGFVLALPAAMVFVLLSTAWAPQWFRWKSVGPCVFATAVALLLAIDIQQWKHTADSVERDVVEVGTGGDRMRTDIRGLLVTSTLAQVDNRFGKHATVLVLPEGIMINYLARRRTPTPYLNFMPPELILFGEDHMVKALDQSPPDCVVLVHKDTSEYGLPLFGHDYGRELMSWVRSRYRQTWVDPRADEPLVPGARFGIAILERR